MEALFDVHLHHPKTTVLAPPGTSLKFVASGFSPATNAEVMEYSKNNASFFSLGLAPQDVIRAENPDALFDDLKAKVAEAKANPALSPRFVAIGECGLDHHWAKNENEKEEERRIFSQVIEFAKSINKPLVIHSRDAEGDCIKMLHDASCKKALLHCFGGSLEQALLASSYGWLVSIPPVPSKERKKIITALPISSLVVESDAPYIGKMSSDTLKSAEMVAKYKGISIGECLSATYANACAFFGVG